MRLRIRLKPINFNFAFDDNVRSIKKVKPKSIINIMVVIVVLMVSIAVSPVPKEIKLNKTLCISLNFFGYSYLAIHISHCK